MGSRAATRRLHGIRADHGLRYLEANGELLLRLVQILGDRGILQIWSNIGNQVSNPRYIAPEGKSAIAKFLATGLEVKLNQRLQAITAKDNQFWHLDFEANGDNMPFMLKFKNYNYS